MVVVIQVPDRVEKHLSEDCMISYGMPIPNNQNKITLINQYF